MAKNPKHWQHQNAGENVEQQEVLFSAGGNGRKGTATLEGSFVVFKETKHTLSI